MINYDKTTIDFYYHNILNGFSPFLFKGELFLAKHSCSKDAFEANSYMLLAKERLIAQGVENEYTMLKECISRGLWSQKDDIDIQNLQNTIKKKEELISKLFLASDIKKVKAEIKELQTAVTTKENEKFLLLANSLEYLLLVEKRDYLAYLGIYTDRKTQKWPSYDSFTDENSTYISEIIDKYYNTLHEIKPDIIRAIARCTDARIKLKGYCPNPCEVSVVFLELKQWCDFYNSIYEIDDRPDESIIQNDDKLDGWLSSRKAQNQSQKSVNNSEGYTGIVTECAEDIEFLGGVSKSTVLATVKKDKASK